MVHSDWYVAVRVLLRVPVQKLSQLIRLKYRTNQKPIFQIRLPNPRRKRYSIRTRQLRILTFDSNNKISKSIRILISVIGNPSKYWSRTIFLVSLLSLLWWDNYQNIIGFWIFLFCYCYIAVIGNLDNWLSFCYCNTDDCLLGTDWCYWVSVCLLLICEVWYCVFLF